MDEKEIAALIENEIAKDLFSDNPGDWRAVALVAARRIAERLKAGVVFEDTGIVVESPDYYENERGSVACIAYSVEHMKHKNSILVLGTDYHDPEVARQIHSCQRVRVTVRLEDR